MARVTVAASSGSAGPADEPGAALESFSPLTGERLGAVPATGAGSVQAVVDDVAEVQPFWAALPPGDRARYLRRAAQVVIDELDELATLLCREQGKPRTEALTMELVPTVDALHWIADHGPRILRDRRIRSPQLFLLPKRHALVQEPLGVIGVITPWNHPWSIPFGDVAVALMCGNGVVLKPAPETPLVGERIRAVFERAGVPEGIVRTVHGGGAVGRALVESGVAKVLFTGSAEVGRRVGVACAERIKGSVLQLGGKDPQIVLADANLAQAVSGALWAGFAGAGQTCAGIERVYVMREVAERFTAGVVEGARRLRVGDPMRPDTEVGPMASRRRHDAVRDLIDDAVAAGATLRCGGPVELPAHPEAAFVAPAVLTGVRHDMRIMREEVLGPVLPVVEVDSEEEAIALANDASLGLGASVWTRDRAKGERIAGRIEAGMVWVNDHGYSHAAMQCAWGGVKESGLGRSHGEPGLRECVSPKLRAWDPSRTRDPWWFPYDESLARAATAAATLLYGRDPDKWRALRAGAAPIARLARRVVAGGERG